MDNNSENHFCRNTILQKKKSKGMYTSSSCDKYFPHVADVFSQVIIAE